MKHIITAIIAVILTVVWLIPLAYPELFCPRLKYQLKSDISRGDTAAIEYYEKKYTSKGIILWEE